MVTWSCGRMRCHPRRIVFNIAAVLVIGTFLAILTRIRQNSSHSMSDFNDYNVREFEGRAVQEYEEEKLPKKEVNLKENYIFRKKVYTQESIRSTTLPGTTTRETTTKTRSSRIIEDLSGHDPGRLWYDENHAWDDRILAQLRYKLPYQYEAVAPIKTLLVSKNLLNGKKLGQQNFLDEGCSVNKCSLTGDNSQQMTADVVIGAGHTTPRMRNANPNQIRIIFQLESPHHSQMSAESNAYNWTATYRRDSTIVAPYEKFVLYDNKHFQKKQNRSYANGKTKNVAWFVSNCRAKNKRLEFAKDLGKYIDVDIYGSCGTKQCPKHTRDEKCFKMLARDYKFYLSFENSNCKDYITEKLYWNGFQNDILPIVMGAHKEEYTLSSPYRSFLHVDDFNSTQQLAEYLHYLDQNDEEYNKYFEWKGTGEFINTKFLCRVCAMAHAADIMKHSESVDNLATWWRGPDVCFPDKWMPESLKGAKNKTST